MFYQQNNLQIDFVSVTQSHYSCLDSPSHPLVNPILIIIPALIILHSRLKTFLFNKSFPR